LIEYRRRRLARFRKRGHLRGVELVQYHADDLHIWGALIPQPLHLMREVSLRPPRRDRDVPPARLRCTHHEQGARAVALVLIVVSLAPPWSRRKRRAGLLEQLLARLLEGDGRTLCILRFGAQLEDLFPGGDKRGIHGTDAPWPFQPRLALVFFSPRRTVSYEHASAPRVA
jgi:hypothetical protein